MAEPGDPTAQDSRHLTLSEGSSHKFWSIELDGSSHTVKFGKIGTAGQSQTKAFDDVAAARKSFAKLIAEKTKKGYADATAGVPGAAKPVPMPAPAAPAEPARTEATGAAEAEVPIVEEAAEVPAPPAESRDAPAAGDPADLVVHREIRLDPEDWFRAGFRPRPLLRREAPRPFDRAACLDRLAKLGTTHGWADLELPAALSPEEAHFWLVAMTEPRTYDTPMATFAATIGGDRSITGQVSAAVALDRIKLAAWGIADEVSLALANLLPPEEHLDIILEWDARGEAHLWHKPMLLASLIGGFRRHVVPYLSDDRRRPLRERVRRDWDPTREPGPFQPFPAQFYLAAALNMHDAVREITSRWSEGHYTNEGHRERREDPQELVFGLGSAEEVESEWRRLKLRHHSADHVRSFLACTEYAALDCVADSIVGTADKNTAAILSKTFALVVAPEAAAPMLRCKLSSRAPAVARDWLDEFVGCAVAGLIDVAGGRGQLADSALDHLRGVKRQGLGAAIAAALEASGAGRAARVRAEVLDREEKVFEPFDAASTPGWLAEAIEAAGPAKRASLPDWASASMLPPLTVGDRRLSDAQIDQVLQRLARTAPGEKSPLMAAIRGHVSRSSRDEFAWTMFQYWHHGGYAPKEKWAMGAIAHIGDDGCVLKLTPRIRAWPGESQHARAVFGLECLRAIGSSVALMQLAGIAQKLKFKGLQAKAEEFVEQIARERGLTRDELEDRVVPDCGLDEHGRREFPFGPRSFTFALGGDLKAMVRDEAGKLRPNLPDANARDDAELARTSVDEWKLLKKQIKEVAALQAGRLEQAMVTGRRWDAEDFATLLVRHPLMTHLARKLVWAGFDAAGRRVATFRVTEEQDYADAEDEAATLDGVATVGIVHPLDLADAERGRWGEVLGDYEIVPPFAQLGRTVYPLEPGEESAEAIKRLEGVGLPAPTLVFTLEKLGWTRGMAMDAGCFDEHSKQFPAADVTAVIGYTGAVGMGFIDPDETLIVSSVHFCKGMRDPSGHGWGLKAAVTLGQVPPVVVSEVLADLHVLKGKAK